MYKGHVINVKYSNKSTTPKVTVILPIGNTTKRRKSVDCITVDLQIKEPATS